MATRTRTGTPVSTRSMTFQAEQRRLVAEVSQIPASAFYQAYADSCDIGLTVESHRTGRQMVFVESEQRRDAEGELHWTDFVPASPADRKTGITLRLLND